MAKPKFFIPKQELYELRKKAALEYYQFRILEKPKNKAMTPLAKKVHTLRIQRRVHAKLSTNEHIRNANRIEQFIDETKRFREDAKVYRAEWLVRNYSDIINKMNHSSVTAFLNAITRVSTPAGECCILDLNGWHRAFLSYYDIDDDCGKWMHFFKGDNYPWAASIVEEAVAQGICSTAKCSLPTHLNARGSGVICLYGELTDYNFHKRCTQFMIDHNMIQKTKKGVYYNISFKMDWMTMFGIYGQRGQLKLEDIRDLQTGKWIADEKIKNGSLPTEQN